MVLLPMCLMPSLVVLGEEEGGVEFVDVVADEGVVPYESDEVREHLVYGRLVAQIGVGESIETCDLLGQRTLWVDELAVPFDRSAVPDADGPDLHDPVIRLARTRWSPSLWRCSCPP